MFNLIGKADLRAISVNKSGGETARVFVTLGIEIDDQPGEVAAAALGAESAAAIADTFHWPAVDDPDRNVRFYGIGSVVTSAVYDGKHSLTIAGFDGVRAKRVSKIALAPTAKGLWRVNCAVLLEDSPAPMLEVLAEMLHDAVPIRLEQDAELPLEGGGAHMATRDAIAASPAIARAVAAIAPKPGSGIDSVTISTPGGPSVTLTQEDGVRMRRHAARLAAMKKEESTQEHHA